MSGRSLPIQGGEAGNCVSGVAFLEAYNQGRLKNITGKVICIGGGDTSIDVVSVARRLGNIENDETHIPAMIDRQKAFLYHEQYPTNHEHCDQKGKSLDKAAFGSHKLDIYAIHHFEKSFDSMARYLGRHPHP
jgi:hypothetical protein